MAGLQKVGDYEILPFSIERILPSSDLLTYNGSGVGWIIEMNAETVVVHRDNDQLLIFPRSVGHMEGVLHLLAQVWTAAFKDGEKVGRSTLRSELNGVLNPMDRGGI